MENGLQESEAGRDEMSSSTFNSEPSTFRFPFCGSEATMLLKTQSWLSSSGSESHDVNENKATYRLKCHDVIAG